MSKSIFISFYLVCTFYIALIASSQVFIPIFSLAWLGTLLAAAAVCLYFIKIFLQPQPRTPRYIDSVITVIFIGAGLTIIDAVDSFSEHIIALFYNILILGGWIAYEFWYSKIGKRSNILKLGKALPAFTLPDQHGRPFASGRLLGRPALLLFFRGNWCPFGVAQIKELIHYTRLYNLNLQLVFISPQSLSKIQNLANRLEDNNCLLLSDANNEAARSMGITHRFGTPFGLQLFGFGSHNVLPTVIVTDSRSHIAYLEIGENFRVHPQPESYLQPLLTTAPL